VASDNDISRSLFEAEEMCHLCEEKYKKMTMTNENLLQVSANRGGVMNQCSISNLVASIIIAES